MLVADFLSWWYLRGWVWVARQFFVRYTKKTATFFSIADLVKTLFSPFRQDTIDTKNVPLSLRLQAFGGNIISRLFGLIIRTILIVSGGVGVVACILLGVIIFIIWPLIPLALVIFPALAGVLS